MATCNFDLSKTTNIPLESQNPLVTPVSNALSQIKMVPTTIIFRPTSLPSTPASLRSGLEVKKLTIASNTSVVVSNPQVIQRDAPQKMANVTGFQTEGEKAVIAYYKEAVARGSATSITDLLKLGVEIDVPQNLDNMEVALAYYEAGHPKAVSLLHNLVGEGDIRAYYWLGNIYKAGKCKQERNINIAVMYYTKAAYAKESNAQTSLAKCYNEIGQRSLSFRLVL